MELHDPKPPTLPSPWKRATTLLFKDVWTSIVNTLAVIGAIIAALGPSVVAIVLAFNIHSHHYTSNTASGAGVLLLAFYVAVAITLQLLVRKWISYYKQSKRLYP